MDKKKRGYEKITLDGCYKELENIYTNKIEGKNGSIDQVRRELEQKCDDDGISKDGIDFTAKPSVIRDAIVDKLDKTAADYDTKVAEIDTIESKYSLKDVYTSEKTKIEEYISLSMARIKEIKEQEEERQEELRILELEKASFEADIVKIENVYSGKPAPTDPDFDEYNELVESKEEREKTIDKLTKQFENDKKLVVDCENIINDIIKEFSLQGYKIEKKVKDFSKENAEENKDKDKDKGDDSGSQPQNVIYQNFAPGTAPAAGGAPQPTGQQPAPAGQPSKGSAEEPTKPQPRTDTPASEPPAYTSKKRDMSVEEKIEYIEDFAREKRQYRKENSGKSYMFKKDSEITLISDILSDFDLVKLLDKKTRKELSKLLDYNVEAAVSDINAANMDDIKAAIKGIMPSSISDADIDTFISEVYGSEAGKVAFLDKDISEGTYQKMDKLFEAINAEKKKVLSYLTNKDKFDSLAGDATIKDGIKKAQERIAVLDKYLVSPINLKNSQQQVDRAKFSRILSRNNIDPYAQELSKKSREELNPKQMSAAEKFAKGLADGVDDLHDPATREEWMEPVKSEPDKGAR